MDNTGEKLTPQMKQGLSELAETQAWKKELRDRVTSTTAKARGRSNYPQYIGAIGAAAIAFLTLTSALNPNSRFGEVEQVQSPERGEVRKLRDFLNQKTNLLVEDNKLEKLIKDRSNPGNPLFEYRVMEDVDTNIAGKFTPANPNLEHHSYTFKENDKPGTGSFWVSLTVNKTNGEVESASITLHVGEDTFFDPSKDASSRGFLHEDETRAVASRVLKNRQDKEDFMPAHGSMPYNHTILMEAHENGMWESVRVEDNGSVNYHMQPDPNLP